MKKQAIVELKVQNANQNIIDCIEREDEMITVPKIKDIIGTSLKYIGPFKKLNTEEQKVALINDVSSNF